jgi:hypothetical protein
MGCPIYIARKHVIEFPSEFAGTWKRDFKSPYTSSLTFTSNTVSASNQSYYWDLYNVSGNDYSIKSSKNGTQEHITVKFNNGKLEIIDGDVTITNSENIWTGTWRKK